MAKLEELLYSRLITDTTLLAKLARYKTRPAVFNGRAPDDTKPGWAANAQEPRLEYVVNINDDAQRKVSGSVLIDITTSLESTDGPDVIDTAVKNSIDGVFFETDSGTSALRWQKSDFFTDQEDVSTGITSAFDLLLFPRPYLTAQPAIKADPIYSLMEFSKTLIGATGAFYINGTPQSSSAWKPSSNKPAIYWRFVSSSVQQITNAVTWINLTAACHVMAPSPSDTIPYIKSICESLGVAGEVVLGDESPFTLVNAIEANSGNDQLSLGQISITGRYGVLRERPSAEKLQHIQFSF